MLRRFIAKPACTRPWGSPVYRHSHNSCGFHSKSYRIGHLQSSSSTALAAVTVGFTLASGVYVWYLHLTPTVSQGIDHSGSPGNQGAPDMPGQLLPGRPGNLTVDQEVKLQDLWKATFKVFGVELGDVRGMSDQINGADEPEADEEQAEDLDGKADAKSPDQEKKKKKKRNLFSRKKKEKEPSESKAEKSVVEDLPINAADDKYGQTKEFLEAVEKNKPEEIRDAFWRMVKADHPDALLLRFLRARKWDIQKALVMMVSTLNWRLSEMKVDEDVMLKGELDAVVQATSSDATIKKAGDDFLTQLRQGKSFVHGTDKEGRPMCIVRARLHRKGEQTEKSIERFTVYLIETARLVLIPPVDTANIIFDMTGFSMANLDYEPVKFMIKCFEANYPESLGVVLVHKAPWVFQGVWKIIRGWLDPVVAGKVHFTNSANELEAYIARDHIPTELGGEEKWTYEYVEPDANENDKQKDTATRDTLFKEREAIVQEFEEATRTWVRGASGEESLKATRNNLAEKLKNHYWQLDPYIRARSLYDRTGLIGEGGVLTYYPGKTHPPAGGAGQAGIAVPEGTVKEDASEPPSGGPIPAGHDEAGVD